MFCVVAFRLMDEAGSWGSPRCVIVTADGVVAAVDKVISAVIYPHADPEVWGEAAEKSSPEKTGARTFSLTYDDEGEDVTIHLEVFTHLAGEFATEDGAEEWRDEVFKTHEWVYSMIEE